MTTRRKKPVAKKPSSISAAQAAATARRLADQKKTNQPTPGRVNPGDPAGRVLGQVQPKPAAGKPAGTVGQGEGAGDATTGEQIAGMALSFKTPQQQAALAADQKKALADPALYGKPLFQNQPMLDAIANARNQAQNRVLVTKGNAVYMGQGTLKKRRFAFSIAIERRLRLATVAQLTGRKAR